MASSKTKWKIETPWGSRTVKGSAVDTSDGELHILGENEESVAVFPPGQWHAVERKPRK